MGTSNEEKQLLVDAVFAEFESRQTDIDTDEELGADLFQLLLWIGRIQMNAHDRKHMWASADIATVNRIDQWDTNDPLLLMAEKVFKRVATGHGKAGVLLVEETIKQRAEAFRRKQSETARKSRSKHPITKLVERIVNSKPGIDLHGLLIELKRLSRSGDITVTDTEIFHPDLPNEPVKISALKSKLNRAKK